MAVLPTFDMLLFGKAFKTRSLDAYGRILMDTVRGNSTLFMRRGGFEWHDEL